MLGNVFLSLQAYKNFGTRVSNLKRKLEEHMKTLPSPVPSPTPEAPSPGNTPPMLRGILDNTEAIDMDLSEEDDAPSQPNGMLQKRLCSNADLISKNIMT